MAELDKENLYNITFTDVMKLLASDNVTEEHKIIYIYLLNFIMDINEKVDKALSITTNVEDDIENK